MCCSLWGHEELGTSSQLNSNMCTYAHAHIQHVFTHLTPGEKAANPGTECSKSLDSKEYFYQGEKKKTFRDKTTKKKMYIIYNIFSA